MVSSMPDVVSTVERSVDRFTHLLRSGLDAERPLEKSSWTIRQLGAHLASGTVAYRNIAVGEPSPYAEFDDRATTNQERIEAEEITDLDALADKIDAGVADILAAWRAVPADAVVGWHGGILLPVGAVLGAITGEFLLHGLDLARTVKVAWPIERRDALPVVDFFYAIAPHILDREAVRGVSARVELGIRGYDTATFDFDDGTLTVTPGRATKPHVHMSVDPVAFLLMGYKRTGLARPILSGRALAWGRRPWLAVRFVGLFQDP